MAYDFLGSVAE